MNALHWKETQMVGGRQRPGGTAVDMNDPAVAAYVAAHPNSVAEKTVAPPEVKKHGSD